jgi:hypothetical protein
MWPIEIGICLFFPTWKAQKHWNGIRPEQTMLSAPQSVWFIQEWFTVFCMTYQVVICMNHPCVPHARWGAMSIVCWALNSIITTDGISGSWYITRSRYQS